MLYPHSIETKLGFDQVKELIKKECTGELGAHMVDKIQVSNDFKKVKKLLTQAHEFKSILEQKIAFPNAHFTDVRPSLEKVAIEGTFLDEEELYNLRQSLGTIFQCFDFFKGKEEDFPELTALCGWVTLDERLLVHIDKVIDQSGKIKANASRKLQEVRASLQSQEIQLRKTLDRIYREALQKGYIPDDQNISMRNGRMVIPISSVHKRHMSGVIQDESATGQTVYIEPTQAVEVNNEIRELHYAERREIIRILKALTDEIRPFLDPLHKAYRYLAMIDFIRAKARWGLKVGGHLPTLKNKQVLAWNNVVHPLLLLKHQAAKKPVVPLSLRLDDQQRIILISGPNAGGKSVALKTTGLVQMMTQSGILPTVDEDSTIGLFQNFFVDIGDEQSIDNDLSTYSSHLTNMRHFLKHCDAQTLFLIDEFGSGTEPKFGAAIAEAILVKLHGSGAYGIITSHYANLKKVAEDNEGIANAGMQFDIQEMAPSYMLDIGKPGSSYALEIAGKIGLPQEVISLAKEHLGDEEIRYDQLLSELEKEKREYTKLKKDLSTNTAKYKQAMEEYESLKASFENRKSEILKQARAEAQEIVRRANQKVEETIRGIRESQAEKQRTKALRDELEKERQALEKTVKTVDQPVKVKTKPLKHAKAGDRVRIKGQEGIGLIEKVRGKQADVVIGHMKTKVQLNKLEMVDVKDTPQYDKTATKPASGVKMYEEQAHFSPQIDIRGRRAEEVQFELQQFLDKALMLSQKELRILHGKGHGVLREVVHNFLKDHKQYIESYREEHPEHGGAGVTVVRL